MKKITFAVCLLTAFILAQDPGQEYNYIGINTGTVSDWEGNIMFADAIKSSRAWCYPDDNWDALPENELDEQGWPEVDAQLVLWHGLQRNNSGTYYLTFESNSQSTIDIMWTSGNLENVVYNSVTNVTTANLVLTDPESTQLALRFTNTNGGVRNVKLMRPVSPGSSESQAITEDFSRPFLNAIAPFQALRFMDYCGTYSNQQVHWSDRVQPNYCSFNRSGEGYSWLGKGGAWEYIIKLCNQTQKDAWICIPLLVDDDYVHQLAKLFRDGNEFTNNAGLDPNLKLYVEYANEVWNTAGEFDGHPNHNITIAEQANGDPYLYAYDGNTNDWYWAMRRVARKAVDISRIFREEFGDAKMMTQVRPVYEWQLGYTDRGSDPLTYLENAYIPLVDPGHPVNYFLYAGGGSAYYSPYNEVDTLTLDNFWDNRYMNEQTWGEGPISTDAVIAASSGIKRIAYEGGSGFDDYGHSEDIKEAAWLDSRMYDEVVNHHNVWSEWGGDLLVYYTLRPNNYQWGFMTEIDDLSLPKYQGTASLNGIERSEITHFKNIPGEYAGIKFDLADPSWKDSASSWYSQVQDGEWRSYIFNVQTSGTFRIELEYSNGSEVKVILLEDGNIASQQDLSGNGTDNVTVDWQKGMHSVRVKADGGSFTIDKISASIVALDSDNSGIKSSSFELSQNYPNPFNPTTNINYSLNTAGVVVLTVFDILGREIVKLVNEEKNAGNFTVQWNGKNSSGQKVGSGVYLYQLKTNSGLIETKKMLLIK